MTKPASEAIPNELLLYERKKRYWTREDVEENILAIDEEATVDANTVGRWERGVTEPTAHHLRLLTMLYQRSVEELGYVSEDRIPFCNLERFSLPNPFFTGRESFFEKLLVLPALRDEYQKKNPRKLPLQQRPQALTGLGGIGKTQIALAYAYRYMHNYHTIVWLRADSLQTLRVDFAAIATLLNLPEKQQTDQEQIITAVKRWFTNTSRWLLIFDNADTAENIYDFIPSPCYGHLLITTRSQSFAPEIGAYPVEVDEMAHEEAMDFLLQRAGIIEQSSSYARASQADQNLAQKITETLGRLPLALDQAGAYIQRTQCGLSKYYDSYQKEDEKLLQYRGNRIAYSHSVASTWSMNFKGIREANATAIELLYLFAFLDPDAIPEALLLESASKLGPVLASIANNPTTLDLATEELLRYSLVRRNFETKAYSIHRLVQTVVRASMTSGVQKEWAERTVKAIHHIFPMPEAENWSRCEHYLPHALACASHIEQWHVTLLEAAELLNRIGYYLWQRAQYTQAATLCEQALALTEQNFGTGHSEARTSLSILTEIYYDQGKYSQAEQICRRLLTLCQEILGNEHPDIAEVLHNLGAIYHVYGEYKQAEQFYLKALDMQRKTLPPLHATIATSLNTLASVYEDQEFYDLAEEYYIQARKIYEQSLSPQHFDVITNLNNLAGLYYRQGKYSDSEALLREALSRQEYFFGHEHTQTATYINNLGRLYHKQQRFSEAEQYYQDALQIYKKTLGPVHHLIAGTLKNFGELYSDQKEYEQAESYYVQALTILEQSLGSNHPTVASYLDDYATFLEKTGRKDKARKLRKRIQHIRIDNKNG